jgi:hypothetical protein
MQDDSDDSFLELTHTEREALRLILSEFLLYQNYQGAGKRYCMRQKSIWINRKNFLEPNKHPKGAKGLWKKKAIQKHPILGYQISIKPMYLDQIYTLLDNDDWELVMHLAGVWIDAEG